MKTQNQSRFNILRFMLGILLLAGIGGFYFINRGQAIDAAITASPPVFNELQDGFDKVHRIRITVPEGAFQIIRHGASWVMPERDNFPVADAKVQEFATDLKYLRQLELNTNDPSQFDRLGVGEPKEFGEGTTFELFDTKDEIITARHIARRSNIIFVRKLGEKEVYSAAGQWKPIERKGNWLDFNFLNIVITNLYKIEITQRNEKPAIITRDENGALVLDDGQRGRNIDNLAQAIAMWQPLDVISRQRINSAPIVHHKSYFNDGLVIDADLFNHYGVYWLEISASNLKPEAGPHAAAINARAQNWAFAISEPAADILQQKRSLLSFRGTNAD